MNDVMVNSREYSQSSMDTSQEDENEFVEGIGRLRAHNWNQELEEMGYPGNKEVIVKLLDEFTRGVIDVFERLKLQKKIPKNFIFPDIYLAYDLQEKYSFRTVNNREPNTGKVIENALDISLSHLHNLTQSPTLNIAIGNRLGFETKDVNRLLVYAAGVEEGAHIVFSQNKPVINPLEPREVSITKYHSQDHEYHGLGWQIRLLKDAMKNGHDTTEILEDLENVLQTVIKFRRETRRLEKIKDKFISFAQKLGMEELKIECVWQQLAGGDANGFSRMLMPRLSSEQEDEYRKIKAEITSRSDR